MDIINDIEIEVEQAVNGAVNISTNHHIPVSAFTIFGIIHNHFNFLPESACIIALRELHSYTF